MVFLPAPALGAIGEGALLPPLFPIPGAKLDPNESRRHLKMRERERERASLFFVDPFAAPPPPPAVVPRRCVMMMIEWHTHTHGSLCMMKGERERGVGAEWLSAECCPLQQERGGVSVSPEARSPYAMEGPSEKSITEHYRPPLDLPMPSPSPPS